jgi:hypothetical protein
VGKNDSRSNVEILFPCPLFFFSAPMPPKKTSEPPLSKAESLLLKIAARIFTAVKHKERHPEENHINFQRNMTMEMVRDKFGAKGNMFY